MGETEWFECISCSYRLILIHGEKAPGSCPMCRGRMVRIEDAEIPETINRHECKDCHAYFFTESDVKLPYKCIQCNYTFVTTSKRRSIERL